MTSIKRFVFIGALIGVATAMGAATLLIWRWDLNDYRSLVESNLSGWLRCETTIDRLAMNWQDGIRLKAEGIRLQKRKGEVPFVAAESVTLEVNPFRLLREGFVLCELRVKRPNILLVKRADGGKNWAVSRGRPKAEGKGVVIPWVGKVAILFSRLTVEEGSIHYREENQTPPLDMGLDRISMRIQQAVPGGLINISGRGNVPGETEAELQWVAGIHPLEERVTVEAEILDGQISLQGEVNGFKGRPRYQSTLDVKELNLDALSELLGRKTGRLAGTATGRATAEAAGSDSEEVRKNLVGKGSFEIRDGMVRQANLVQAVLKRITPLPGLNALLIGVVPEPFREVLKNEDTSFETLQGGFQIENERMKFEGIKLKSQHFLLEGEGEAGFDRKVDFSARLVLLEGMSRFLTLRINELSMLTNQEKQVVVPFVCRGQWPRVYPQPDVGYVANKVIMQEGKRLVELVKSQIWGEPPKEQT